MLTYVNNNRNNTSNDSQKSENSNNSPLTTIAILEQVEQKSRSELNRAFFLILDYITGSPLECNYNLGNYLSSQFSESSRLFCQSLAGLISFDMLINNCDRIPLVHLNDGNATNILITREGECIPIDTVLTSIHPTVSKRNLLLYCQRLEAFFSVIFSLPIDILENQSIDHIISSVEGQKVLVALNPLKEFIYRSTVFTLSNETLILIAIEIQKSIRQISSLLSEEILTNLKEKVSKEVSIDWEGVWEASLKLINLEYLSIVLNIFQKYSRGEGL